MSLLWPHWLFVPHQLVDGLHIQNSPAFLAHLSDELLLNDNDHSSKVVRNMNCLLYPGLRALAAANNYGSTLFLRLASHAMARGVSYEQVQHCLVLHNVHIPDNCFAHLYKVVG